MRCAVKRWRTQAPRRQAQRTSQPARQRVCLASRKRHLWPASNPSPHKWSCHRRRQQILDMYWQIAHTDAGSVVDSVGDSRGDAGQAYFANAAYTHSVEFRIRIVEEDDVELRRVSVAGHDVVGQIAVDRHAVALVVISFLEQRHADTHDHRAFDLVAPRQRVDDAAGVDHGHHPLDPQSSDARLPGNLDEVRTVGMGRVRLVLLAEGAVRLAVSFDVGEPRLAEYVLET